MSETFAHELPLKVTPADLRVLRYASTRPECSITPAYAKVCAGWT